MAQLPAISGAEAVRAFKRTGWQEDRQRGSHVILIKIGHHVARYFQLVLSLPRHMRFRHRFHLLLGVLDHLAGYVRGHLEDSAGELEGWRIESTARPPVLAPSSPRRLKTAL